jgi:16S rRNA (guanine966-N2)-methyltransferase
MRITGGGATGRQISIPKTDKTRPLSDRGREALFNILGDVTNFCVLDCFAGSGAVGLEALSRGAGQVDAVEIGREARKVIGHNIDLLKFSDKYHLFSMPIERWLKNSNDQKKYNLIFVGAPFGYKVEPLMIKLSQLLLPAGVLVVEYYKKLSKTHEIENITFKFERRYGESVLLFYQAAS